ncbi:AAA family ATPase (plasmid) [Phyllobacterium sp. 628]|uniref:AAA family ATPase n=1 Tax=Phyllobacterium sp. 628 TaxID=2718938 RepID=UPI0016626BD0|nr:AAA family ATPase [Phyllobacterium sp. 628]QND54575.1 AAA family ATPase [Phyllobacterium sp. 628]
MRLRKLDLTRYGKFTDYSLDFGEAVAGSPDLHIVYGLNEAGKSTAFAAYLDFLFGIEERSKYAFLHPYTAMQIGATLQFDGQTHQLIRSKVRTGSLQDERGQPVNEALLGTPLAGIGREAYRTMFSLDEQSLKDGGNAIIQSKGDLGELLFSASAGLADLSQTLAATAEEASLIHKKRGRNTQVAELKQKLADLKAQRDAIDTFASAYANLVTTGDQAQSAYDAAMAELGKTRTSLGDVSRIIHALPLAGEHSRLKGQLADFADLPRPPSEWAAELPQLTKDQTRIQTQIDGTQREFARLQSEIDAIEIDDQLQSVAARILALEDGRARYRTAEEDLPKRRISLGEQNSAVAGLLKSLGQDGNRTPEALVLPAALIGELRSLIETRSGIDATLHTTSRELAKAKQLLERIELENADSASRGKVLGKEDARSIETALGSLQRSDHQARLRVAERDRGQLSRNYDALLTSLHPWIGDGAALLAFDLPEPRRIEAWRSEALLIEKRIREHKDSIRKSGTEEASTRAHIEAIQAAVGHIDDVEAQRSREARTRAWEQHLNQLDLETAKAFEEKMRVHDDLSETRLARSRDLAELRQAAQTASVSAASIQREKELLADASDELLQLHTRIRAAVSNAIELPENATIEDWLSRLERWNASRKEALAAWNALREVDEDIRQAKSELDHEVSVLVTAMGATSIDGIETMSPPALMQTASAFLSEAISARSAAENTVANLAKQKREISERQEDFERADAQAKKWDSHWNEALSKTWFGATTSEVPQVREILNSLADLPAALRERDQLAQRIATMENNQIVFGKEVAGIFEVLGETFDPAQAQQEAETLTKRYQASQSAQNIHAMKLDEHERLADISRKLKQELAVHEARKSELTAFFDVETLTEVSAKLEQAADKARLERRLAGIADQIADELRVVTFPEAEALLTEVNVAEIEQQAAELSARSSDLEEQSRVLFADLTLARKKLEQVGGDDAVARIEAQRRTIFLEIEELAQKYLRLKTGALAAENALHLYRDKHRSSMMNRASDAFRLITRGEYSGLAAKPEKDKEILIGVSKSGASKMSDAMSTGTQFQLYLALRLAGYQEFAEVRPSVPFIADDIMETFDEPRSEEVFRLMSEMASIGQVIYLTHHRHLCEIAQKVLPSVRIHELNA